MKRWKTALRAHDAGDPQKCLWPAWLVFGLGVGQKFNVLGRVTSAPRVEKVWITMVTSMVRVQETLTKGGRDVRDDTEQFSMVLNNDSFVV